MGDGTDPLEEAAEEPRELDLECDESRDPDEPPEPPARSKENADAPAAWGALPVVLGVGAWTEEFEANADNESSGSPRPKPDLFIIIRDDALLGACLEAPASPWSASSSPKSKEKDEVP